MRYRLMATYLGVPYQAGLGPDGTDVTLFSPAPPPEELGFAVADGHWRKQVGVTDLDALWQSRPVGEYRGEPCLVLDDLGDRLHIAYLGRDAARAAQLGYWEIDREVFEVVVVRYDVTGLTEERVEFPLAAATFPPSGAEPQAVGPVPAQPAGPAAAPRASADREAVAAAEAAGSQPAGYGGPDHASRAPDRAAAWHGSPEPEPWPAPDPWIAPVSESWTESAADPRAERESRPEPRAEDAGGAAGEAWPEPKIATPPARGTGRKDRTSAESVFAELLTLSAIPPDSYAVDEEVPGAMCLVKTDGGFEVFGRTEDARLEVRFFGDEEAAYFYLFGVLAAEAVRSGRLRPEGPGGPNGHSNGASVPGTSSAPAGDVSKYLRRRNLPKSPSRPARVYLAGGADGPPLPKQPRRPPELKLTKPTRVSQIGNFTITRHTSLTITVALKTVFLATTEIDGPGRGKTVKTPFDPVL